MNAIIILLVVHLFDGWSGARLIKDGVLSFQSSFPGKTYCLNQSDSKAGPGEQYISLSGEYMGDVKDKDVVICGVYFGACVSNCVASVSSAEARKIILPMKLIAHSNKRTLYNHLQDNFRGNKDEFISEYLIPYFTHLTNRKFECEISNDMVIVKFDN